MAQRNKPPTPNYQHKITGALEISNLSLVIHNSEFTDLTHTYFSLEFYLDWHKVAMDESTDTYAFDVGSVQDVGELHPLM